MRPIPVSDQSLAFATNRAVHVRVRVTNDLVWKKPSQWGSAGTVWDLTRLNGWDFVEDVSVTETMDNQVATAEIHLFREAEELSLNPEFYQQWNPALNGGSGGWGPGSAIQLDTAGMSGPMSGTPWQVIWPGMLVKIEVQLAPCGAKPNPNGTWNCIFDGVIDDIDTGDDSRNQMTVNARDMGSVLQDLMIETNYPPPLSLYDALTTATGSGGGGVATPGIVPCDWWYALVAKFGTVNSTAGLPMQQVISAVINGVMGNQIQPNPPSPASPWPTPPAVYVEDDPAYWYVPPDTSNGTNTVIQAGPLLDWCVQQFAALGLDFRWRYQWQGEQLAHPSSQQANPNYAGDGWTEPTYQMSCWLPRGGDATRHATYGVAIPASGGAYDSTGNLPSVQPYQAWSLSADLFNVTAAKRSRINVRNRIGVYWYDTLNSMQQNLGPIEMDTQSTGKYGVRTMIPAPDATQNITAAGNPGADGTALQILADLKTPWLTVEAIGIFFPYASLGDIVGLGTSPRMRSWPSPKWMILTGFTHTIGGGKAVTQLTGRELINPAVQQGTVSPALPPSQTYPAPTGGGFAGRRTRTANTSLLPNGVGGSRSNPGSGAVVNTNVRVFLATSQTLPYSPATAVLAWGSGGTNPTSHQALGDVASNVGLGWQATAKTKAPIVPAGLVLSDKGTNYFLAPYTGSYQLSWNIVVEITNNNNVTLSFQIYVLNNGGYLSGGFWNQTLTNPTNGSVKQYGWTTSNPQQLPPLSGGSWTQYTGLTSFYLPIGSVIACHAAGSVASGAQSRILGVDVTGSPLMTALSILG